MAARFDLSGVLRAADRSRSIAKNVDQAKQRAIGTLKRRLATEARRDIQEEYSLPAGRIAQGLSVSSNDDSILLTGSGRGIDRINFAGRQAKGGLVSYQIFKQGGRETLPDAFIATGLKGNTQIFERTGRPKQRMKQGNYKGQLREPIESVYGPSIAQMLRKSGRADRLADFAQKILSSEIQRQLRL